MFKTYILFSDTISKYYTGHSQDLENRLTEHNSGETSSIKGGIPWRVVWFQELSTRRLAIELENKIKKRGASRFLSDLKAK